MKNTILGMLLITSSVAQANLLETKCHLKASDAVKKYAQKNSKNYDENGIETLQCRKYRLANKTSIICEVKASKGDGAANDTYEVELNQQCTRKLKVLLVGEE